jgi:DNA-binding NarL/FixJ family response regulator
MLTLKEAAELYVKHAADMRSDIVLSDTERNLLLLEAAGCTASEIATTLRETDKSIQERQKELSRKLNIVNKSGARIAKAMQFGLIDPKEIKYLKR